MEAEKAERQIRENWDNPLSTLSFLSAAKLYDHFGGVLKRKEIEDILSSFESYSLQKEERSSRHVFDGFSLPTHIDNIIEIDSFQINELSNANLDVAHILCGINTFSKRLYAIPLIKRDAESGLEAIKEIFRLSKALPDFIVSDQGGECSAKLIRDYLKSRGVTPIIVSGRHKAASVERVQRTLQKRIYTYMNQFQTESFLPVLSDLIFNYNSTKHSTIKCSPFELEDSPELQQRVIQQYIQKGLDLMKKSKQKQHFKVGQRVRVHIKKSAFMRSYHYQTNLQRYIVSGVNKKFREVRYKLKDENGVELKGFFYSHELVAINLTDKYRARKAGEEVIKGKKYARIQYLGYPQEFDKLQLIQRKHRTTSN